MATVELDELLGNPGLAKIRPEDTELLTGDILDWEADKVRFVFNVKGHVEGDVEITVNERTITVMVILTIIMMTIMIVLAAMLCKAKRGNSNRQEDVAYNTPERPLPMEQVESK